MFKIYPRKKNKKKQKEGLKKIKEENDNEANSFFKLFD